MTNLLNEEKIDKEDRVEITYYTDPLCCWSWAMEPQWKRLRFEYQGKIKWKYCMGGLIPDWNIYNDPLNSVSRPLQMGPLWFEARHISGQPINDKIWMEDPPKSSYPACIAYKCAERQSPQAAESYLRLLREAAMLNARNIAKNEILIQLAMELNEKHPGLLSLEQFESDLKNKGIEDFKADMAKVRYDKIGRFPTFVIKNSEGKGVIIVGYRPYEVLIDAVKAVVPNITPTHSLNINEYSKYWNTSTEREVQEVMV